jgi:hypothetical protein
VFTTMQGSAQWTAWRLGLQPLEMRTIDFALAPPTFFLLPYWFDACAPNIFAEHSVFAAFGELAAVAATIFTRARQMRGAKPIAIYGFALPPTATEIRTVESDLSFWRRHVEARDARAQCCTQPWPVRRRPLAFLLKHVAFARDERFGCMPTALSSRPQRSHRERQTYPEAEGP